METPVAGGLKLNIPMLAIYLQATAERVRESLF